MRMIRWQLKSPKRGLSEIHVLTSDNSRLTLCNNKVPDNFIEVMSVNRIGCDICRARYNKTKE